MFRKIALAVVLFSLFAGFAGAGPISQARLTGDLGALLLHLHPQLSGGTVGHENDVIRLTASTARVFAVPVGSHTAGLNWILSVDDDAGAATPVNCVAAAGCAQNVYRAQGLCTSTTAFTLLTTTPLGATATTFTDSSVTPGNWCYGVTFTMNGLESSKDSASVSLQPASPTGLAGIPH